MVRPFVCPPIGATFGRLTVVGAPFRTDKDTFVRCQCSCGTERDIRPYLLIKGQTKSCGCFRTETTVARSTTHGLGKPPEYGVWNAMISRCHRATKAAHNYRERGITVCERWRASFADFYADMGPRPSSKHTIERKDNDGNYEPGNCRWATRKEQARNARFNQWIEFEGRRMVLADWANELRIKPSTLWMRLYGYDWPLSRALKR